MLKRIAFIALVLAGILGSAPLFAEDWACEVVAVEGEVTLERGGERRALADGDLLRESDVVITGPSGSADLAFDRDLKNIVRVEDGSQLAIQTAYPSNISVTRGALYAKLRALPKESLFEVETPTAIASVRGTEFRTAIENGETQVYNLSQSEVYVFGRDASGEADAEPVIVKAFEASAVTRLGERPRAPKPLEPRQKEFALRQSERMDRRVGELRAAGRAGKIPPADEMARRGRQRVEDARRRGEGLVSKEGSSSGADRVLQRQGRRLEAIRGRSGTGAKSGELRKPGAERPVQAMGPGGDRKPQSNFEPRRERPDQPGAPPAAGKDRGPEGQKPKPARKPAPPARRAS